jgi:hypothetical protein
MLVIMFGHRMYRGKDTAALHLIEKHGFKRFAFADALRHHVGKLYNMSWEQLSTELKSVVDTRYNLTPRQILQDFGREQRNRDPHIWVRQVCEEVKNSGLNKVVITDFRYPNEYYYTKKSLEDCNARIVTIRIDRPELDDAPLPGAQNESELALSDFGEWNHIINNDSSVDDLHKKIEYIYHNINAQFIGS